MRNGTWIIACAMLMSCNEPAPIDPPPDGGARAMLTEAWASSTFPGCTYASPVAAMSGEQEIILATDQFGRVSALDPDDGTSLWDFDLPRENSEAVLDNLATPGIIDGGHAAIVGWQEVDARVRTRTRLAVVDLDTGALHADYPLFDVSAQFPAYDGSTIEYDATYQLLRSEIVVRDRRAYVAMGNGPSVQPFHGWIFELDLDAWQTDGGDEAIGAVFNTSATNDCGAPGNRSGRSCGAGVWNAAGVQLIDEPDGSYSILFATGNGRLDYTQNAYAYSALRLGPGLTFERGCDETLCAEFDPLDAPVDCLASCENVFSAHLPPGDTVDPEDGICDGLAYTECLHVLDGDLGASMPVVVQPEGGPRVVVQPGKDGAIYLLDYDRMGTLYQRLQLMDFCGTLDDECRAFWIGTLVTHPAVTMIDGDPVIVVASVMADNTHPSGISALRVVMQAGEPRLELMWQVPEADSQEAKEIFRHHPGRPIMVDIEGEPFVFVVETRRGSGTHAPPGVLWGVRVRDGWNAVREPIPNAGQRFAVPLVHDDRMYITTCNTRAEAEGQIVAYDIAGSR